MSTKLSKTEQPCTIHSVGDSGNLIHIYPSGNKTGKTYCGISLKTQGLSFVSSSLVKWALYGLEKWKVCQECFSHH